MINVALVELKLLVNVFQLDLHERDSLIHQKLKIYLYLGSESSQPDLQNSQRVCIHCLLIFTVYLFVLFCFLKNRNQCQLHHRSVDLVNSS